jgi:hypothetical protein
MVAAHNLAYQGKRGRAPIAYRNENKTGQKMNGGISVCAAV